MILEEAKRLYDTVQKHFTNSIMDNAVGASSSSDPKLSSTFPRPSTQNNTYRRIKNIEVFIIVKRILLIDNIISTVISFAILITQHCSR